MLLDGVDIKKYKQSYLRNHVGLVQQDVFLFSDSVNFNIAYGKIKASEQEIEQAAKLAAADDLSAHCRRATKLRSVSAA